MSDDVTTTVDEQPDQQEQVESVETPTTPAAPEPIKQWDKERQFRDELAAANRREGELKAQKDHLQQQYEQMQSQLDSMQKQKDSKTEPDPDLDDYDQLKNTVIGLRTQLKESSVALQESRHLLDDLRKQNDVRQEKEQVQQGLTLLNQECDSLDKKYGGKYRNDVIKKVTELFQENDVARLPAKARAAWIKNLLKIEYIDARDTDSASPSKKSSGKKVDVTVDTGTGGSVSSLADVPEGSMDEVFAKYVAAQKAAAG